MNLVSEFRLLFILPSCFQRLSRLIQSGMDLKTGLAILRQDEKDRLLQQKLQLLSDELERGISFTHALYTVFPSLFPFYSASYPILNLPEFLDRMVTYYDMKVSYLRTLQKQLVYPFILLFSLLMMGILFVTVLLPAYAGLYSGLNMEFPSFLSFLLSGITYFKKYSLVVNILLGSGAIAAGYFFIKKTKMWLKECLLPSHMSDFFWIWGMMLENGLSVKQTLDIFDFPFSHKIGRQWNVFCERFLKTGVFSSSLSESFSLSPYIGALLANAEKSGTLKGGFFEISHQIREKDRDKTRKKLAILQPALLIGIGIFIFVFATVTFLPLLSSIQNL